MIQNKFSEFLDRCSRKLALREHYTLDDYQWWLDHNPVYLHSGAVEQIQLTDRLTKDGTNDLFRARYWIERIGDTDKHGEREIVLKFCKYWVAPGKNQLHRLNMITSSFEDEIRINNLIRATNIEGVVQSFGGGTAGRLPYLKMELIKGCSLDKTFKTEIPEEELIQRIAQIAYLANTISQLHYYQIIHKDLKPKNLMLCQDPTHINNHKILVCDFGYAQAKLRESVTEYGGQLTPCYSAPEQAVMGENLSSSVDYFSFGVIMHEFLTGHNPFPDSMKIFVEDNYHITERYLEHIRTGRKNLFNNEKFPEIHDWIDQLTTFDSFERMQKSENLFNIAHRLREKVNALGYRDVNTDFLWNQLREYRGENVKK
ncbi:MAG: protein kinase [Fibrobacteraceae bacterium]